MKSREENRAESEGSRCGGRIEVTKNAMTFTYNGKVMMSLERTL
jgi:hypothetical protein